MGLFSKQCVICGKEYSNSEVVKIKDVYACRKCIEGITYGDRHSRYSTWTLDTTRLSVSDIKKRQEIIQKWTETVEKRREVFEPNDTNSSVWFDDANRLFAKAKAGFSKVSTNNSDIFSYDEIVSYSLVEDGKTITKGGLTKGIIGGALFGPVGAIAGATSKKVNEFCTTMDVVINLNTPLYTMIKYNAVTSKVKKGSLGYRNAISHAQAVMGSLQRAMDLSEEYKERGQQFSNAISSISNTKIQNIELLRQYKSLLDEGVITKEEFDAKKKELL